MRPDNLTILTHTHSECFDVFFPYIDCVEEFIQSQMNFPHVVLSDKPTPTAWKDNFGYKEVLYSSIPNFSDRLLIGLDNCRTDLVMFMLEDYIPYDYCNEDLLLQCMEIMNTDDNVGFIRLLQSGAPFLYEYDENFYAIDKSSPYFFSTQATIWRKDVFRELGLKNVIPRPQSEIEASVPLREMDIIGLCTKGKGNQVGGHHDSIVVPYTAVAILGGKWNTTEYPEKLKTIFSAYEIDPNIRGCV